MTAEEFGKKFSELEKKHDRLQKKYDSLMLDSLPPDEAAFEEADMLLGKISDSIDQMTGLLDSFTKECPDG